MLVFTRKVGQQVIIHPGMIQVKVLKAQGDMISLGFHAPPEIHIDREEVYVKKMAQGINHIVNGG